MPNNNQNQLTMTDQEFEKDTTEVSQLLIEKCYPSQACDFVKSVSKKLTEVFDCKAADAELIVREYRETSHRLRIAFGEEKQ